MPIDPRDMPLESTGLQANPSEPVPVLRVAEPEPSPAPGVKATPLAQQLAVLLRCHEGAAWFRVWQWIWWGIRALVVIGVTIPLCIGIGYAAFYYTYDPPSRSSREYRVAFNEPEFFIHDKKVSRAEYDEYQSSGAQNTHHSHVVGWATGLGTAAAIALLWAFFEGCWYRRYQPLEDQIAALQHDHAGELATWGSPGVLRDAGAVAEMLGQHSKRAL